MRCAQGPRARPVSVLEADTWGAAERDRTASRLTGLPRSHSCSSIGNSAKTSSSFRSLECSRVGATDTETAGGFTVSRPSRWRWRCSLCAVREAIFAHVEADEAQEALEPTDGAQLVPAQDQGRDVAERAHRVVHPRNAVVREVQVLQLREGVQVGEHLDAVPRQVQLDDVWRHPEGGRTKSERRERGTKSERRGRGTKSECSGRGNQERAQ